MPNGPPPPPASAWPSGSPRRPRSRAGPTHGVAAARDGQGIRSAEMKSRTHSILLVPERVGTRNGHHLTELDGSGAARSAIAPGGGHAGPPRSYGMVGQSPGRFLAG